MNAYEPLLAATASDENNVEPGRNGCQDTRVTPVATSEATPACHIGAHRVVFGVAVATSAAGAVAWVLWYPGSQNHERKRLEAKARRKEGENACILKKHPATPRSHVSVE